VQNFTILDDGRIRDSVVVRTIERLKEDDPHLEETAIEANMMLFRTYAAYFTTISSLYEKMGLSHARFNMLRLLYQAPENRLTMTALGAALEASIPNVIRMVQGLEGDGWVTRVQSKSDRRVTFVELTDEGNRRFRSILPGAVRIWEELQQGLTTQEQAMLSHLLTKLRLTLLTRYIGDDLLSYRIEERKRKRRSGG
jgi:DNA-binding MarR family transcriptional regulator